MIEPHRPPTKRCSKCGQDKPRAAFFARKKNPDGLEGQCRECRIAARRAWRHSPKGRPKYLAACKRRQINTKYKAKRNARARERYHTEPNYRARILGECLDAERAVARKAVIKRARAKYDAANPEKNRARRATRYAVSTGRIPKASTLPCIRCGKPAQEYHHHRGYDAAHRLDVVPVCKTCHEAIDHGLADPPA